MTIEDLEDECAQPIQWPGGGEHDGHTITATDRWEPDLTPLSGDRILVTSGRVRCSCGAEWNVGGWPLEVFELICPPGVNDGE